MTQKPACLYLSEVIPPRANQPVVLGSSRPRRHLAVRVGPPRVPLWVHKGSPACSEHPGSCGQALGRASPAPSPGGARGDVPSPVQAPRRANQGPLFLVLFPFLVVCTQPWQKGCDGRRRVFCHPHRRQLHRRGHLGL